jgi:hypothetical protein
MRRPAVWPRLQIRVEAVGHSLCSPQLVGRAHLLQSPRRPPRREQNVNLGMDQVFRKQKSNGHADSKFRSHSIGKGEELAQMSSAGPLKLLSRPSMRA